MPQLRLNNSQINHSRIEIPILSPHYSFWCARAYSRAKVFYNTLVWVTWFIP